MHFQDFKPPIDMEEKHRKLVAKAMKIAEKHTRGPQAAEARAKKDAAAVKAAASDLRPEAVMRRLWEEATADVSPMKMKMYDKHRSYKKDDVISHKAHGLGVVVRDDVEFTVTVLFRDQVVELDCDLPREE
jgi:8-oxo-dGTP pyrophosphatase MutT (NUDIX family)